MSSNESVGDSGAGTREIAHRLFACEFDAATLEYADSDEERAPKYVITPTGARVNRLFVVGVLTEIERVNEEVVRARVVDPTGAFVVYAGQYQPDALAFLERADPPMFVAVTGKANTFQPEDSDRVYTSVRPESIAEVDAETRDRWTVQAAEHTLGRIGEFARVLDGGQDPTGGVALAREEYATTPTYLSALRDTALDAARLVAGEVEEVTPPGIAPDDGEGRAVDLGDLVDRDATVAEPDIDTTEVTADAGEPSEPSDSSPVSEPTMEGTEPETDVGSEPDTDAIEAAEGGEGEPTETPSETSETGVDGAGTADTTEAPPVEPGEASDPGGFGGEDSEPSGADSEGDESTEAAADENELYEFDAEERAEIEAEFDMDFSSGNEVDEPGEADIDVPESEPDESGETSTDEPGMGTSETADLTDVNEPEPAAESEPASTTETESPEGSEEVDLEDRAMAVMSELADGDGADREAVIERVAGEAGVDPEAVDEAIDSALLSGRCYEPQDGVLKSI